MFGYENALATAHQRRMVVAVIKRYTRHSSVQYDCYNDDTPSCLRPSPAPSPSPLYISSTSSSTCISSAMARCVLILLLPVLLCLSLLADARHIPIYTSPPVVNNVDDPLILHDAFEQNPLRLPTEREREMMIDVPQLVSRPQYHYTNSTQFLRRPQYHSYNATQFVRRPQYEASNATQFVRRPWYRAFNITRIRSSVTPGPSVTPGLREGASDLISSTREGASDLISSTREREGDFIYPLREGERESGGETQLRHEFQGDGDHLPFRPQKETVSSSSFESSACASLAPCASRPGNENEESRFEPREKAFERIGKGFPEREHKYPHGHGQGQGQWDWQFPNGEESKHRRYERHEYHHGGDMKFGHFRGDHLRFRPQFPRPSSFPSSEVHGKEAVSSSFRSFPGEFRPREETEESGFESRERAFERIWKGFPEREHNYPNGHGHFPEREHNYPHGHGQGPWEWEFPNGEEHNHRRHERQAPWEWEFANGEEHNHGRHERRGPWEREFPNGEEHNHGRHERQGPWEWEFSNHGRQERHEYPDGGEMKFRHFGKDGPRGDHLPFRPQLPLPSSFPSSGHHGKEAVSSSFRNFSRELLPRAENEESGFQPRQRGFEHIGGKPVFPDREHSHGQWELLNGEEHKRGRHGNHYGDAREFRKFPGDGPRGDHIHLRPQFPRSSYFPSSGDTRRIEAVPSLRRFPGEFLTRAKTERFGFQPRERAFQHIGGKPVFPDREHRHGQWELPNREEHEHGRHESHEDRPARWTGWLMNLFRGH